MYHRSGEPRSVPGRADELPGSGPLPPARLALERVRTALTAYTPAMPFDAARYRAALNVSGTLEDEAERSFCLGWLHWLNGDAASAEPLLLAASIRARETNNINLLAEAAYWQARVGLRLHQADALANYEAIMRNASGLPRATAWFVDLLWRVGRLEKAEQILKTVGGNRRFSACEEVPLLEARSHLRRGDLSAAERVLIEAVPAGCVAHAERWLLLAWIAASQNKHDEAARRFDHAQRCLYPPAALEVWRRSLASRAGSTNTNEPAPAPPLFGDFLRGQEHRLAGRFTEAAEAYRAALESPAAPFAQYALACLGSADFAALLATRPGLFLALRCRAQIATGRFLRREASPAEWLDALQLAATVGYGGVAADHYRTLATALRQRNPDMDTLRTLAGTPTADAAAKRNYIRAAAELAGQRLLPAEACALLQEWSAKADGELQAQLDRQLLRLRLLAGATEIQPAVAETLLDTATAAVSQPHAAALWSAAKKLGAGEVDDIWRASLHELPPRWQPLARALLVYEAARRGDLVAVVTLLDDADLWLAFGPQPPAFVVAAVESAVTARPDFPAWTHTLPRWLGLWQGIVSEVLSSRTLEGARTNPPAGTQAAPWYLHQASRALTRKDYIQALACLRRISDDDTTPQAADVIYAVTPDLERFARAQALAAACQPDGIAPLSAALLVDAVDLLLDLPAGVRLLNAAVRNDVTAVHAASTELFEQADLPPRLAHHFALLERRCAEFHDAASRSAAAAAAYRRSWGWWLRLLAAGPPDGLERGPAALLTEALLGGHRRLLNALLARTAMDSARMHWELIGELPARAAGIATALGEDFATRIARFRDELATDFLLATRESMRNAPAPEGFRADYNAGLSGLRRLLSLDRDNPRLLTALVDTCGDWFFDLYNAGAGAALTEQVERFTPFALHLARLVEGRPGDLAARAALAGFCKFRGFVATDAIRKAELYREALSFNPADENVRELLAKLEENSRQSGS
jgi:hypothetical protein